MRRLAARGTRAYEPSETPAGCPPCGQVRRVSDIGLNPLCLLMPLAGFAVAGVPASHGPGEVLNHPFPQMFPAPFWRLSDRPPAGGLTVLR